VERSTLTQSIHKQTALVLIACSCS